MNEIPIKKSHFIVVRFPKTVRNIYKNLRHLYQFISTILLHKWPNLTSCQRIVNMIFLAVRFRDISIHFPKFFIEYTCNCANNIHHKKHTHRSTILSSLEQCLKVVCP